MGRASAVGRASDMAVEWEGLVLTWHGKGEWEGRRRRHPYGMCKLALTENLE